MKNLISLLLSALITVLAHGTAIAQTDFYRGKTITFIINMAAGDVNDLWARALTRSLVKFIPGNPSVIAQNMAGGGSMIAANYLYRVPKPDGLTIGQISAGLYFQQLTGRREVQFDWRKFSWIGSAGLVEALLMMRADAPYKSIEDIRAATEPPKCSATAPGSSASALRHCSIVSSNLPARNSTFANAVTITGDCGEISRARSISAAASSCRPIAERL